MLNIPNEVKYLFQKDSVRKNFRVHFPNGEEDDICNDRLVSESVTFTESICSQDDFKFGLCESPVLEFECFNVSNIKGYTIEAGIEIDVSSLFNDDGTCRVEYQTSDDVDFPFYYVPYGVFVVDSCKRNSSNMKRRSVTAYNKIAKNNWENYDLMNIVPRLSWYQSYSLPLDMETLLCLQNAKYMYNSKKLFYIDYIPSEIGISLEGYTLTVKDTSGTEYDLIFTTDRSIDVGESTDCSIVGLHLDTISKTELENAYSGIISDATSSEITFSDEVKQTIHDYIINSNVNGMFVNIVGYFGKRVITYDSTSGAETKWVTTGVDGTENPMIEHKTILDGSTTDYSFLYTSREVVTSSSSTSQTSYCTNTYTVNTGNGKVSKPIIAFVSGIRLLKKNDSTKISTQSVHPNVKFFKLFVYEGNYKSFLPAVEKTKSLKTYIATETSSSKSRTSTSKTKHYFIDNSLVSTGEKIKQFTQSAIECQGRVIKYDRYGSFSEVELYGNFFLYPAEDLYPDDYIHPWGNSELISKVGYEELWYDDAIIRPYGRACVNYTMVDDDNPDGVDSYAYIDYVEDFNEDDYKTYDISDNEIIQMNTYTEDEIEEVLANLGTVLYQFKYMPCEITMKGLPYLEAGDYIRVLTEDGGFNTIIMRQTIEGIQSLKTTIESN